MLHFVEQIMDVLMGWTNKKQTAFKIYEKKTSERQWAKPNWKKNAKQIEEKKRTKIKQIYSEKKNDHSNLIQEMKWNL